MDDTAFAGGNMGAGMTALETVGSRGWCWTHRVKAEGQKAMVAS